MGSKREYVDPKNPENINFDAQLRLVENEYYRALGVSAMMAQEIKDQILKKFNSDSSKIEKKKAIYEKLPPRKRVEIDPAASEEWSEAFMENQDLIHLDLSNN